MLSTRPHLSLSASLLALAFALSGCVGLPLGVEPVSLGLQQRTQHALQPAPVGSFAEPRGVSIADGLSENEAVSIALCNNALFLETLADLGISRAEVVNAGMIPNPTLSLLFPSGSKQLEFTARLATETLWLRPMRVAAAKTDYRRTADLLVQNGLDVIRNVKLALADVLAAQQRLALAEEFATLNARIEQISSARVKVGDASELEVGTVEADTLQARELVVRTRQDVEIAVERLRAQIGMGMDRRPIKVVAPARPRIPGNVEELVKIALASRPDLRAAEMGVEAAAARTGIAKAEIFMITASLDANRNRIPTDQGAGSRQRIEAGPGVDVTIPILNQNQGGRARANAQLEKARRQYFTVRDRIVLEVREAHLRCLQAQQSYESWRTRILPPMDRAVEQARSAFESGNVPLLLVLENTRKRATARTQEVLVSADLRRATAELERAMGGRIYTR